MEAHGNGSSTRSNINGHEYTSISQQEGDKNDDEISNNIKRNDIVTTSETTVVPTLTPPAAPTKPQLRRRLFEKLRTKRRQMITQHHHQYDTTNATLDESDSNLTSSGNVKAVMKKQSLVTHYYRVDTVPRKTLQLPRNKKHNKSNTTSAAFMMENEPPIHDTTKKSNLVDTTGTTTALRHSPLSIMNNQKRRNQSHHHETVVNVILPGVPSYEEDWARDTHDYFNLIILVPVTVLNIMNWNWDILLSLGNSNNHHHHHHRNNNHSSNNNDYIGYMEYIEQMVDTLQSAWTGDWFDIFFYFTAAYFIIDLLWIIILPICVKSPSTIIQHHIAVLLYIMIPYIHPHVRFCMGACMSVEINTWFLIARRVFNKQGFPPWTLIELNSWLSIRVKVISIFFYLTWISIRCILYPGLLIPIYKFSRDHTKQTGTVFHLISAACVLHAAFCLLNLKWSYELLMSKIRYFRRQYVQRKQQLRYDRNHPQNHNNNNTDKSSSHRYQQDPSISEGL